MSLQTHRYSEQMAVALQGETGMPTTCYRINGTMKVESGIMLDLKHIALAMNDQFVSVDEHFPPIHNDEGLIKRAMLKNLGKQVVLAQPDRNNPPILIHINTTKKHITSMKERLGTGVRTRSWVAYRNQSDYLVCLQRNNDQVDVFYQDGSVARFVRIGSQLMSVDLSIEQQAEARIQAALSDLKTATTLTEQDRRIRMRDRVHHELISILAVGGKYSANIFRMAFDVIKEEALSSELAPGVANHLREALRAFPNGLTEFDLFMESNKKVSNPLNLDASLLFGGAARVAKGAPKARQAYVAARALERQQNAPAKGPTGSKPSPHNGKKHQKK